MKILYSGVVLFLFAITASAQTTSAQADVVVLQDKWRFEVRNPALEKDPLSASKEHQRDEAAQKATDRQNENRTRQGETLLPPPVRQSSPDTGDNRLSVAYIYEFKFKNTGTKKITSLTFEYLFFEPGTSQQVGRLRFEKLVTMKPGSTKNLVVRTASSPTGTLDANKANKKSREQYSTQVLIRSIEYADGSIWRSDY